MKNHKLGDLSPVRQFKEFPAGYHLVERFVGETLLSYGITSPAATSLLTSDNEVWVTTSPWKCQADTTFSLAWENGVVIRGWCSD